jgi:hypothetical protein
LKPLPEDSFMVPNLPYRHKESIRVILQFLMAGDADDFKHDVMR